MSHIAVIDCGLGNLHSVVAGIERAAKNTHAVVTSSPDDIAAADKVIFPGDGNFGACMRAIDAHGLHDALSVAAREKPFLGICVGMQVLCAASEESDEPGLGVLPLTVRRLPADVSGADSDSDECKRKIPHLGWNQTHHRRQHRWTRDVPDGARFYFAHSYYVPVCDDTLMTTDYGETFSAVIGGGHWMATQFHPEKSGEEGIRLLENFVRLAG